MTRIYFVATKPDITKAARNEIFYTKSDAEFLRRELMREYDHAVEWKVFSALVEVEKQLD